MPPRLVDPAVNRGVGLPVAAAALWTSAVLAGCAPADAPVGAGDPHAGITGGDVPTTPRALAHLASLHTGRPDTATRMDWGWTGAFARGSRIAVDLRYRPRDESDGESVGVVVGRDFSYDISSCAALDLPHSGCVEVGGDGLLAWQLEAPEEDPGIVYVFVPRGRTTAVVGYAGPAITGDPREMALPVPVEKLVELATDPRVDVTTTAEAVDEGEGLAWFRDPR